MDPRERAAGRRAASRGRHWRLLRRFRDAQRGRMSPALGWCGAPLSLSHSILAWNSVPRSMSAHSPRRGGAFKKIVDLFQSLRSSERPFQSACAVKPSDFSTGRAGTGPLSRAPCRRRSATARNSSGFCPKYGALAITPRFGPHVPCTRRGERVREGSRRSLGSQREHRPRRTQDQVSRAVEGSVVYGVPAAVNVTQRAGFEAGPPCLYDCLNRTRSTVVPVVVETIGVTHTA